MPWRSILPGAGAVLLSFYYSQAFALPPLAAMLLMLAARAGPMWLLEYRRISRMAGTSQPLPERRRRDSLVGGALVVAMLATSIRVQDWLGGNHAASVTVAVLILAPTAVLWLLWLVATPNKSEGSVEQLARALITVVQNREASQSDLQCILGWCVKAFFLPLMLGGFYDWLDALRKTEGMNWSNLFFLCMAALYALDTLFATIGYLSTHRGIDAHIRSTDATWLGWASALACYSPFNAWLLHKWLNYRDGIDWNHWLADSWLSIPWAAAILILTGVYTFSTLAFGPRFSNLTNRGIITAGPFRWTKHPAYISKNLSWWLIAVPFVSAQGMGAATINCAALLGINAVYWVRAKTEERHLMRDPVYQVYAAWISEHGMWARMKRRALA